MTDNVGTFLLLGAIISGLMAVFNALRYKSRGISAYIMAGAFVVLGCTMLLLRAEVSQALVIAGCVLLVILLGADFAARSQHNAKKDLNP
jgi:chromate transport protein ChrA